MNLFWVYVYQYALLVTKFNFLTFANRSTKIFIHVCIAGIKNSTNFVSFCLLFVSPPTPSPSLPSTLFPFHLYPHPLFTPSRFFSFSPWVSLILLPNILIFSAPEKWWNIPHIKSFFLSVLFPAVYHIPKSASYPAVIRQSYWYFVFLIAWNLIVCLFDRSGRKKSV